MRKSQPKAQRTYKATGGRLLKLAQSFDLRRYKAAVNFPTDEMAWEASRWLDEQFPELADSEDDYRGGILGPTDRINAHRGSGYVKFRLRYWTRRQLYNRLRWLKGELSRLILKQQPRGREPKPLHSQEERLALILKRRSQIAMYTAALDYFKPLHEAVRKVRKVKARRDKRQRERKSLRKRELKAALQRYSMTVKPH